MRVGDKTNLNLRDFESVLYCASCNELKNEMILIYNGFNF